jgi:DNA-binding transcriptional LysR family regulator
MRLEHLSGVDLNLLVALAALLRERSVTRQGLKRHVACTVENLAIAPLVLARTDLLCSAPGQTIAPFAEGLGLRVLAPPFAAPGFDLHLAWHERNEHDAGHAWLRESILGLFANERS